MKARHHINTQMFELVPSGLVLVTATTWAEGMQCADSAEEQIDLTL